MKLEAEERKVLRKDLRQIIENVEYRRLHNNELKMRLERITDTIRERKIAFCGHISLGETGQSNLCVYPNQENQRALVH